MKIAFTEASWSDYLCTSKSKMKFKGQLTAFFAIAESISNGNARVIELT